MPLSQALAWVAGDGWSLVVDPVNRLVSFEVNARYAARPAPTAATVANAPADNAPLTASGTTRVSPSPYDPYASSVSYADSPSFSASHSTAGYGGSFSDGSYVASPHAILLTPPAGDDYNDTLTAPPPRKSVREVTALRPATTRLADLKTVSPGTDAEKSGKATAGKKARKSATGTTPALLPVSTGEKTASRSKTATPATATATARTVASASGTKAAARLRQRKRLHPTLMPAGKRRRHPLPRKRQRLPTRRLPRLLRQKAKQQLRLRRPIQKLPRSPRQTPKQQSRINHRPPRRPRRPLQQRHLHQPPNPMPPAGRTTHENRPPSARLCLPAFCLHQSFR